MTPQHFLCATCGTQFPAGERPPVACPICEDDRQYVPASGQRWATMAEVRFNHHNKFREVEDGLHAIITSPPFAIGQRAYLIQSPAGNLLWDCVALLDADTIASVWALGGITAIAISHPHYYTSMVEWSSVFGGVPILIHADDKEWVQRPSEAVQFWDGHYHELADGLTLIRCGGHFPGASVLHWAGGAQGKGILLPGDTIQVCPDGKSLSFMYSYPNYIPLNAAAVRRIVSSVESYPFEMVFGAFGHVIESDGSGALMRSAQRYIQAIS